MNDKNQERYYDTRTKKAYTFQQYRILDSTTKEFIKLVPYNGKVVNGYYVEEQLSESKDMSAFDRDIMQTIKMVNDHAEQVKIQKAEEQYNHDRIIEEDNTSERVKFAQAEVENISDDIDSRTAENSDKTFLAVDVIRELKAKVPKGNYEFMNDNEIQDAYRRSRNGAQQRKETNKLKVKVAAITLAITMMTGAISYLVVKGAEIIARNDKLNYANTSISQIAFDKEHDMEDLLAVSKNPAYAKSIVWQNCHGFIDSHGNRQFFFYNDRIAADILREPSYAVDMAILQVYCDMGIYRDNGPYHNFNDVMKFLSSYTSKEEHPLHNKFIGVRTIEDYLLLNGYYTLDDSGKKVPSLENWITKTENQMIENGDKLHESASERLNELGFGR